MLRIWILILVDMLWLIVRLKKGVVKHGVKEITTFVMIWLKNEGRHRIFHEGKNTYTECVPETEAFSIFKCCFLLKTELI